MDPETTLPATNEGYEVPKNTSKPAKLLPHFQRRTDRSFSGHFEVFFFKSWAFIFWTYLVANTFVMNVDSWVSGHLAPSLRFLVDYKFLILLTIVVATVLVLPRGRVLFYILYFTLFPLWQFIYLAGLAFRAKSWDVAIAFANAVISAFSGLRIKFYVFSGTVISGFLTVFFSNSYLISAGIALALAVLLTIHIRAFYKSLNQSQALKVYLKIADGIKKIGQKAFELEQDARDVPELELTSEQKKDRSVKLEQSIIFNRLLIFLSKRLSSFQKSSWKILPTALTVLFLLFANSLLFSFIYNGLHIIDPSQFRVTDNSRLYDFFYFSFNNGFPGATASIAAEGDVARLLYMIQVVMVLFVLVILATVFATFQNEKFTRDIDEVIYGLESRATIMERHINTEFGIDDIESAIRTFEEAQSSALRLILKITKGLDKE